MKKTTTQNTIRFEPSQQEVKVPARTTVLKAAEIAGLELSSSCGGMGSCTTCRVVVLKGAMSRRTAVEQEMADMRAFADNERLACQLLATDGLVIEIPDQRT